VAAGLLEVSRGGEVSLVVVVGDVDACSRLGAVVLIADGVFDGVAGLRGRLGRR